METIEIFTGNRAEFGILSPLIEGLAHNYRINLILSGAHILDRWQTKNEVIQKVKGFNNPAQVNIIELPVLNDIPEYEFANLLPTISKEYIKYRNATKEKNKFCLFLGDRIESAAYAITAMYLEEILIHICGGDLGNNPHFDHNIRHSLTKVSHLHFVTNEKSYQIVKQLGEEEWRIANIGMPSIDVATKQATLSREELKERLGLTSNNLVIATYHPDHYMSVAESLHNFKTVIEGLSKTCQQVILTYPNNDPGAHEIIEEIETNVVNIKNIKVIKNLGINIYISLLKNLNTILAGNTSSIVLESSFFNVPSLLLGRRQQGRYRGKNVTEIIDFTASDITEFIETTFKNYNARTETFKETQFIYGNGNSVEKALTFIDFIFNNYSREHILEKHFLVRE